MNIKFIRDDITKIKAQAIVNSANPYPVIGSGTDRAIYLAANEDLLLKERKKIGNIETGEAVITSGFNLCDYIIHTVGPIYLDGKHEEANELRRCYTNCMILAKTNHIKSIAFPLISTGVYGFPKEEGISIAISTINDFLINNYMDIEVIISVFDDDAYALCLRIEKEIESHITSSDSKRLLQEEYGTHYDYVINKSRKASLKKKERNNSEIVDIRTFQEMLIYYMNIRNEKPSEVYKRAGIDRKLFSKIMNNNYHPSKDTVIKLCFGLKLTYKQSSDLLSRADYAFNPASESDRYLMNLLKNQHK